MSFEYLRSRLQGDGDDEADVRYRMDIAQAAFASLSHLWTDHRLSRNMKLRLYKLCMCSEAWNLTKVVSRILNGFNCRCLYVMTGEEYRVRGFAKLKNSNNPKKNWIELNPPTHPPIQIFLFFGNPFVTRPEHSNRIYRQNTSHYAQTT